MSYLKYDKDWTYTLLFLGFRYFISPPPPSCPGNYCAEHGRLFLPEGTICSKV
jgi:hypothetical protein